MSECFNPLPVGLGLKHRSAFGPLLNAKMQLLQEAGLIEKWQAEGRALAGKLVEMGNRLKETR